MNIAQQIIANDFDIENLDGATANQVTFNCAVREDVDGNPISGFILIGKNSEQFINVSNTIRMENLKRSAKRSQQIDASTDDGAKAVINVLTSNERTTAMAVVVGWFGFSKGTGADAVPVKFDPALVAKMFDKFPTWQNKVLAALDKDSNFTGV